MKKELGKAGTATRCGEIFNLKHNKYGWISFVCMWIALVSFAFNGMEKPEKCSTIVIILIGLLGLLAAIIIYFYYQKLFSKYNFNIIKTVFFIDRITFYGSEGFYGSFVLGFAIYNLVLLLF